MAVAHILSAIHPYTLNDRSESDLAFLQHALRIKFAGFLAHAIKLAEGFQLVDSGPPSKYRRNDDEERSGNDDDSKKSKPNQTLKSNPKRNSGYDHNNRPACGNHTRSRESVIF